MSCDWWRLKICQSAFSLILYLYVTFFFDNFLLAEFVFPHMKNKIACLSINLMFYLLDYILEFHFVIKLYLDVILNQKIIDKTIDDNKFNLKLSRFRPQTVLFIVYLSLAVFLLSNDII